MQLPRDWERSDEHARRRDFPSRAKCDVKVLPTAWENMPTAAIKMCVTERWRECEIRTGLVVESKLNLQPLVALLGIFSFLFSACSGCESENKIFSGFKNVSISEAALHLFYSWSPAVRHTVGEIGRTSGRFELRSGTDRKFNSKKCPFRRPIEFGSVFSGEKRRKCQKFFKINFAGGKVRSSRKAATPSFCGGRFLRRDHICKIFAHGILNCGADVNRCNWRCKFRCNCRCSEHNRVFNSRKNIGDSVGSKIWFSFCNRKRTPVHFSGKTLCPADKKRCDWAT